MLAHLGSTAQVIFEYVLICLFLGTFDNGGLNHGLITANMSAMVDLQNTDGGQFSEPFYILLMEKVASGAMMHMWRLVLSSEPDSGDGGGAGNGDYDSSGSVTPEAEAHPGFSTEDQGSSHHHQMSQVHVSTGRILGCLTFGTKIFGPLYF